MEYPKQIMSKPELERMGFPRAFLEKAYKDKSQDFAQKINPGKKTSTVIFETEGFERWRMQQLEMEKKSMHHRNYVA